MTPQDLASLLTGNEYGSEMTDDQERVARDAGLVVVFGASDDLMEFRGAIDDEVAAPGVVSISLDGLMPDWESIPKYGERGKDACRDYFRLEGRGKTIKALWCAEPDLSWTYETTIPHVTFVIQEDGKPYCRGIVFRLEDV